jgi:HD-GYP domain-containing protein (c-di-GMP phosphodiesterase class II)
LTKDQQKKLFEKRPEKFSAIDRTHYQNHPLEGAEFVQKFYFVTAGVVNLFQCHEENKTGNGYPSGDSDLSEAEQVLSLCNLFDEMVTCYDIPANQAYETLLKDYVEAYDWEIVTKLKDALIMEGILSK